jgi:serine/threonine-protein kinase RsbW
MSYINIKIKNNVKLIEPIINGLYSIAEINNFEKDFLWSLEISLREILVNSIIHGNKGDKNKFVSIKLEWDNNLFTISVKDEGDGFSYIKKEADTIKKGEFPKVSGRGWLIVENKMDFLEFKKLETGFKVIAKKYIN